MRQLYEIMFPSLNGMWGEISLDECSKLFSSSEEIPLLDVNSQISFVNDMHKWIGTDYSHGGYLENRSSLWRGMYMMKEMPPKPIHLGIDYNVPARTPVHMPYSGQCVSYVIDKDQDGGWGGKATFYNHNGKFFFIIGHLANDVKFLAEGLHYGRGVYIGNVGDSKVNGGWFPHVHLQCITPVRMIFDSVSPIDGYGSDQIFVAGRVFVATNHLKMAYPNPNDFNRE